MPACRLPNGATIRWWWGYYADPVNGNPGTDATLYEPLVDFKFLNDTGNYLLLKPKLIIRNNSLLLRSGARATAARAGRPTHREGRWIPAGEPKDLEVDNLKPGEKKCQNAFRGAVASFTYTRVTPSGRKKLTEFCQLLSILAQNLSGRQDCRHRPAHQHHPPAQNHYRWNWGPNQNSSDPENSGRGVLLFEG